MAIDLATKFEPYVDEKFTAESKSALVTNKAFDWDGAKTVKVYKVTTVPMTDYDRSGTGTNMSRYGEIQGLDATTESLLLTKDRSFTFAIDKLDENETMRQLQAATALERQLREVTIPEVDKYIYGKMCSNAGLTPDAKALDATNIYDSVISATALMDDANVPEDGRILVVTPETYRLMKKSSDIEMESNIGNELRLKGVISTLDGMNVIKVPANWLPENFGFMIAHPCATIAPVKLAQYTTHVDPPFISGSLVEGRICYDAFIFENKKKAICYQAVAASNSK